MIREKRVKDLMKPVNTCPSVYPDATLDQTLTAIVSSHDSKFALVTEHGKVVGMVGPEEIFETIHQGKLKNKYYRGWNLSNWSSPVYMEGLFTEMCKTASAKRVHEIMRPIMEPLKPDDTLYKAIDVFQKKPNGYAPVMDRGQVIGIISSNEILEEIKSVVSKERRRGAQTGPSEAASAAGI